MPGRILICLLLLIGLAQCQNNATYSSYISKYQSYTNQYYVSTSGSGTTCTQTSPCTMQTALDLGNTGIGKAGPGTVIWFNDGTYTFSSHFTTKASGTSSAHAAYVALNYRGAKIVLAPTSETG